MPAEHGRERRRIAHELYEPVVRARGQHGVRSEPEVEPFPLESGVCDAEQGEHERVLAEVVAALEDEVGPTELRHRLRVRVRMGAREVEQPAPSLAAAAAAPSAVRGRAGLARRGDGRGRRDEAAFSAAFVVVVLGNRDGVEREQQRRQRALEYRAAFGYDPDERRGGVNWGEEDA